MHSFLLQIIYSLCEEVFAKPENNYEVWLIVVICQMIWLYANPAHLIYCEEWLQV